MKQNQEESSYNFHRKRVMYGGVDLLAHSLLSHDKTTNYVY